MPGFIHTLTYIYTNIHIHLHTYTLTHIYTSLIQPVQATGLWEELQGLKEVLTEPREAGKGFDNMLTKYQSAVRQGRGALLVAVCRGKVRVTRRGVEKGACKQLCTGGQWCTFHHTGHGGGSEHCQ